eukprot:jgi/Galph1/4921/GphlegSOOS_G3534.1
MSSSMQEHPYLRILKGRIRNLRKNIDKLGRLEQLASEGATLDPQQLESLQSKPTRLAVLWELEEMLSRMKSVSLEEQSPTSIRHLERSPSLNNDASESKKHTSQTDQSSSGNVVTNKLTNGQEVGVQASEKEQETGEETEQAALGDILSVLHVGDFIINEPDAADSLVGEKIDDNKSMETLSRLHLDSVCYFAKMLTSPYGDVPLEEAVAVSVFHASEYIHRKKKEAIPGLSYEKLAKLVSFIASHPLLKWRGMDYSSSLQMNNNKLNETSEGDKVAEQINFFAQPFDGDVNDIGLTSNELNSLQVSHPSTGVSTYEQSSQMPALSNKETLLSELYFKEPSNNTRDDNRNLFIQDDDNDSLLNHFVLSSARDITLEESISRSVFADNGAIVRGKRGSQQQVHNAENGYKRNSSKALNDETVLNTMPSHRIPFQAQQDPTIASHMEQPYLRRDFTVTTSWADLEMEAPETANDLPFEPNSGMSPRISNWLQQSEDSQTNRQKRNVQEKGRRLAGNDYRSNKSRWSKIKTQSPENNFKSNRTKATAVGISHPGYNGRNNVYRKSTSAEQQKASNRRYQS